MMQPKPKIGVAEALGVRNNSRYLNVGVDNQVTWPRTETLLPFVVTQWSCCPKRRTT